jgi:hypothetical protein
MLIPYDPIFWGSNRNPVCNKSQTGKKGSHFFGPDIRGNEMSRSYMIQKLALQEIYETEGEGFTSPESKESLVFLEKKRRQLLEDREEVWRQKICVIWLESGDENTKLFQAYAKGRKPSNTIWSLSDPTGRTVSTFEYLSHLGKCHFQNLFKKDDRENIADIVWLSLFFPRFVDDEANIMLMEEVLENELKEVLHSFQKNKSLGPYGWSIEFFLGLYDLIGKDILQVVEEMCIEGHMHAASQFYLHYADSKI